MILERGNMWSAWARADLFLITTNACVRPDDRLVMGAGIAKQARDRWPGVDLRIGAVLHEMSENEQGFTRSERQYILLKPEYGLLVSKDWPSARLGLFQVKTFWHMPASIGVITQSAAELAMWCSMHPDSQVHLNFPGIGNGGLDRETVMPLIESLPDGVHVWQFKDGRNDI